MNKLIIKIIFDFIMMILLVASYAYQATGNFYHELIGVAVIILFIIHQLLNIKWFKNLRIGTYSIHRTVNTFINFILIISFIIMLINSVIVSQDLFKFLNLSGSLFDTKIHIIFAQILLLSVGIHLGLHADMIFGIIKKKRKLPKPVYYIIFLLFSIISICGVVFSFNFDIWQKISGQQIFSYILEKKGFGHYFFGYFSILIFYATVTKIVLNAIIKVKRRLSR